MDPLPAVKTAVIVDANNNHNTDNYATTTTRTDTHRHTQTRTDTHRHTQIHIIHTDTHRHTQIHTDTHRYTQIHIDTHRHTQIHTDTQTNIAMRRQLVVQPPKHHSITPTPRVANLITIIHAIPTRATLNAAA